MRKKRRNLRRAAAVLLACAVGGMALTGCRQESTPNHVPALKVSAGTEYRETRDFVLNRLMGADGGVYTNYLPVQSQGEITRGHDVLAESQGLLMLYAVQTNDRSLLDQTWGYVKAHLLMQSGLVAWRSVEGKPADSNATVDDLRIALALHRAAARFHETAYRTAESRLGTALLSYCVKDRLLLSGSAQSGTAAPVLLSYLDLGALQALASDDSRWDTVYARSAALSDQAELEASLPFFRESYDITTGRFSGQKQYQTVSSLLTLCYRGAVGRPDARRLAWLQKACGDSGLYAAYDGNGNAVSSVQSTAVYALAMLTAREWGDGALYRSAREHLLTFQVTKADSPLLGGFGNADTDEAYSFDNLMALLALTPTESS